MKFININTFYNERITKRENDLQEEGIYGVFFTNADQCSIIEQKTYYNCMYLDNQKIEVGEIITANLLQFYCFSENQQQVTDVVLNGNRKIHIIARDWAFGKHSELLAPLDNVQIAFILETNIGKFLTIHKHIIPLGETINIESIEFGFNPCIHIIAITYE